MTGRSDSLLRPLALRLVAVAAISVCLAPGRGHSADDPTAALRQAEEAFAAAAAARDAEAFASWIAEDAVFSGGGETRVGRRAIVEAWAPFFAEGGPSISWSPESVVVAPDGALGTTRGSWRIETTDADGGPAAREGAFFSVWRRGEEGWRVILDDGTPGDAVPAPLEGPFEGLDWLVGTWRGPGLGGLCEETWSRPEGGAMLGMFRLIVDGRPSVYEIMTLVPDGDGGVEIRLKHFDAHLTAWEERNEAVVFPFVSRSEQALVLEGLTYRREGDRLRVEVRLEEGEPPALLELERMP